MKPQKVEHYRKTIEFDGESTEVLRTAMAKLAAVGFKLEKVLDNGVEMAAPPMRSTKQSPLLGASRVELRIIKNLLEMEAELGGVERMRRFVHLLPLVLVISIDLLVCVLNGIIMGIAFGVGFGVPWAQGPMWVVVSLGIGLLPALPWLAISPIMSRWIRQRTLTAFDQLAQEVSRVSMQQPQETT